MDAGRDIAVKQSFDGIVLAGGTAERLGGIDKAVVVIDGLTLLERAVAALRAAENVICVGPQRPTTIPVSWVREEPPGGGPVAALGAALPLLEAGVAVVLAVDVPFVTPDLVDRLVASCNGSDAALVVDADDVPQPLIAAYRVDVLRRTLAAIGDLDGIALRKVVEQLSYTTLDAADVALDCDTWADIEVARSMRGA